jgi:AcrR family transcriptional regulator
VTIDRRVMRTRTALYDALVALIRERDYNAIRVQDILERANIGRSTFYAHFRTKDELLERSLERLRHELLAAVDAAPRPGIVDVTRTLFQHIDRHRDIHAAMTRVRAGELLNEFIATTFTQVVRTLLPNPPGSPLPRELVIAHAGSTFLCVLRWWLERRPTATADEAEELFRSLLFGGLGEEWTSVALPDNLRRG